jgi:hypothetical protein
MGVNKAAFQGHPSVTIWPPQRLSHFEGVSPMLSGRTRQSRLKTIDGYMYLIDLVPEPTNLYAKRTSCLVPFLTSPTGVAT